jgi:ferritin-like metal-binding protein YciE
MILNIAKENHYKAHELRTLFEKQLKELYWAEKEMAAHMPDIIACITSKDLEAILKKLFAETSQHMVRLEKIFGKIGIAAEAQPYEALKCLMGETKRTIAQTKGGVVRDAALIAVLQKIKHYEIACYGTMRAYALALREEDVVTLLEATLDEEKRADTLLSAIAEAHINIEAADKEI